MWVESVELTTGIATSAVPEYSDGRSPTRAPVALLRSSRR